MNFVPSQAYMNTLRELCTRDGCLLIYDEVMTGFAWRLAVRSRYTGSEARFDDLGKIAGGMPLQRLAGGAK